MMSTQKPDISVVIVNYRVKEFIRLLIKSVEHASEGLSVEIIIIDNNSGDESVAYLKTYFPEIQIIENKVNKGFAAANNQGIKLSRGKYIYIVNPDVIIQKNTLSVFKTFLDRNQDYGMVGGKIINPDGSFARECRRSDPDLATAFYRVSNLDSKFPKNKKYGKRYLGWLDENKSADVPVISGASVFCRAEVLSEIKGFDEEFFMYGEDDDLCLRMRKKGYQIGYTPKTTVLHFKGESQKINTFKELKKIQQGLYTYFEKHNKQNYSSAFRFLIKSIFNLKVGVNYIGFKLKSPSQARNNKPEKVFISKNDEGDFSEFQELKNSRMFTPEEFSGMSMNPDSLIFDTGSISFDQIFEIIQKNEGVNSEFYLDGITIGKKE